MQPKRKLKIRRDKRHYIFFLLLLIVIPILELPLVIYTYRAGFSSVVGAFFGLLFIFSLFISRGARKEVDRQAERFRTGDKVAATITDITVIYRRNLYKLNVAYDYHGQHYEGASSEISSGRFGPVHDFKKGDTVTLYLDPANPRDFAVYETSGYKIVEG